MVRLMEHLWSLYFALRLRSGAVLLRPLSSTEGVTAGARVRSVLAESVEPWWSIGVDPLSIGGRLKVHACSLFCAGSGVRLERDRAPPSERASRSGALGVCPGAHDARGVVN